MDYYDPREVGIDDLVKRIRIGHTTKDFLNTLCSPRTTKASA